MIESYPVPYSAVLGSFVRINYQALDIISDWRLHHRDVDGKLNANGVNDVVTSADKGIEELARRVITELLPGIEVFGEEAFKSDFATTHNPFYIVVDPIDGTKEFINGTQDWSISICAVENGCPVAASVFMPDKDERFMCIKDCGVYINDRRLDRVGRRLEKRIGVSPRQIMKEKFKEIVDKSCHTPVEVSALTPKICAILRGDIDAAVYFEQGGVSAALWDYAAVHLLIHEFGGRMTSLTGDELPFSGSEVIHTKGWLATSGLNNHDELLACLGNR